MAENLTPIATGNTFVRLVSGTVAEPPILLPAGLTPSEAFVGDHASGWVDVTAISPQPSTGWTTADGGKTFAAPVIVVPTAEIRRATTYQLMSALTDAQRTAYGTTVKPWDQRFFAARATTWPESNEKIARVAAALGTSPAAWFDAALTPPIS